MKVYIDVETVGQYFGTCGIIRELGTGTWMASTQVRPYGFEARAILDARFEAGRHGWEVVPNPGPNPKLLAALDEQEEDF